MSIKPRTVTALLLAVLMIGAVASCEPSPDTSSPAAVSSTASDAEESSRGSAPQSTVPDVSSEESSGANSSAAASSAKSSEVSSVAKPTQPDSGDTAKRPDYPTVTEKASLLNDLVAGWDLNDGGGAAFQDVKKKGFTGAIGYGVWLPDTTFGRVLDFSIAKTQAAVQGTVNLGSEFTVAAWIKAPVREKDYRIILSKGANGAADYWDMKLEPDGTFSFYATGLSGTDSSGVKLNDGIWHHVAVAVKSGKLTYYVDKKSVKTVSVTGAVPDSSGKVTLGSVGDGTYHFDGSLSRVRIYNKAKQPSEITEIALPNSGNEMKTPTFSYRKGITVDRPQITSIPPPRTQQIDSEDVLLMKKLGFDHIKLVITPHHFMNTDGSLNEENIWYVEALVDLVAAEGIPCLICIHPEDPFKKTYLGNLNDFETMLKWYANFAKYIGERWDETQAAFQLMTEPALNVGDWTWMADRMWGAVRNVLPYHTLITSSDLRGNMERLKLMSPATDSNLIYSFTTYEPYTFGFNAGQSAMNGQETFANYLTAVPWPASPGIIESKMSSILSLMPDKYKGDAQAAMVKYGKGDAYGLYNREWHFARARSLDKWNRGYGGNIHLMCVEYGCLDSKSASSFANTKPGVGVTDQERYQYITDIRESFETYRIGWTYWSYNETFTALSTANREARQEILSGTDTSSLIDAKMLKALGIKLQ